MYTVLIVCKYFILYFHSFNAYLLRSLLWPSPVLATVMSKTTHGPSFCATYSLVGKPDINYIIREMNVKIQL